jgi:hypothetical protein
MIRAIDPHIPGDSFVTLNPDPDARTGIGCAFRDESGGGQVFPAFCRRLKIRD